MVDEKQNQNPNNTEIPTTRENLFPFIDPKSYESKEAYEIAKDEYLRTKPVIVPPYETLEEKGKYGANKLRFKSSFLEGVVCSFGKVSFENQDDGNIKLFYEYDANTEKSLHPYNVVSPLNWKGILPGLPPFNPKYIGLNPPGLFIPQNEGLFGPTLIPPQVSLIQIQSICSPNTNVSFDFSLYNVVSYKALSVIL
jgi:hypothetical protein